jgi:hypothetical protein
VPAFDRSMVSGSVVMVLESLATHTPPKRSQRRLFKVETTRAMHWGASESLRRDSFTLV